MITSFLICILIAYGFVLISVRGRIFEDIRAAVKTYVNNFEKYMYPSLDDISELLLNNSNEIESNMLDLHGRIVEKINACQQSQLPELMEMLKNLKQKVQINLIKKRNSKSNRLFKWLINKFEVFINCPMCQGFWIGIVLACLLAYNPIVLFNQQIIIVNSLNFVALFLWGCLCAGTTWAIDQIVEYFSNNQNN